MLDPTKNYSAVTKFELVMQTMTESSMNPPESCTKGCNTAVSFFRFRLSANRLQYQKIDWANILTASKWANATNAFVDLVGADTGGNFDVCNLTDSSILVIYDSADHGHYHYKTYSDSTGWSAESAAIIEPLTGAMSYANNKPRCIPYYGYSYTELYSGNPNQDQTIRVPTDINDPDEHTYIRGDPAISKAWGFYSGSAMSMCLNTNGEIRFYYGLEYFTYPSGPVPAYERQRALKWGRKAASDIQFSQAGDTVFCLENGIISQGYSPFFLRTLYTFNALPCAKYGNDFWTCNGLRYSPAQTILGEISQFGQDWKSFHCTIPILSAAYNEASTLILRRTFTDGSTIDSNPMVDESHHETLFGHNFTCTRIFDDTANSPLLEHIALSQPHLKISHTLPWMPCNYFNVGSSVFGLLNRYKLILSHDQAKLIQINTADPIGTLNYELYDKYTQAEKQVTITYQNESKFITDDILPGDYPPRTHQAVFVSELHNRHTIIHDLAFSTQQMSFEQPPQHFQTGDQIALGNIDKNGIVTDTIENFSPSKWRQTLKALITSRRPSEDLLLDCSAASLNLANNAKVAQLTDSSVNANHFIQATDARKPTFITGRIPVIRFDAVDDYMSLTNIIAALSNLTYFLVMARSASGSTNNVILADTDTSYLYCQYGGDWYVGGLGQAVPMTGGQLYVRALVKEGANITRYTNGISQGQLAYANPNVRMRYLGLPGFVSNFDIARILFYGRALPPSEMDTVNDYLLDAYGIS